MYENYHEKFKEECFLRNRSAGTTEQYWSAIKTFMKWCDYKPMEQLSHYRTHHSGCQELHSL